VRGVPCVAENLPRKPKPAELKKPENAQVLLVARNLKLRQRDVEKETRYLSPERWNAGTLERTPNDRRGDGEQREPLHPCPVGLSGLEMGAGYL